MSDPDLPNEYIDDENNTYLWIAQLLLNFVLDRIDSEISDQYNFINEYGDIDFVQIITYVMESQWYEYISDDTLFLMGELVYDLGMEDYSTAHEKIMDWKDDRVWYLLENLKPKEWGTFILEAFCYFYLMNNGTMKITPTSIYFTAFPWVIIGTGINVAQIIFLIYQCEFFARGNILLLSFQALSVIQFISSILLTFNLQFYDYQYYLRIWRYISLTFSVCFNIMYIDMIVSFTDLMNEQQTIQYDQDIHRIFIAHTSLLEDEVTWALYDLLIALFLAYMIIVAFPTFVNNFVIIMKETTMNQNAWTLEEDYEEGMFFGYNLDLLYNFGVPEDREYYHEYIKEFTKEYL